MHVCDDDNDVDDGYHDDEVDDTKLFRKPLFWQVCVCDDDNEVDDDADDDDANCT